VIGILESGERVPVLLGLAALLARFQAVFQPVCGSRVFGLLVDKVDASPYMAQVAVVRAAALYVSGEFVADPRVFELFLRVAPSEEVSLVMLVVLHAMLEAPARR
jgi:hypothetical protein